MRPRTLKDRVLLPNRCDRPFHSKPCEGILSEMSMFRHLSQGPCPMRLRSTLISRTIPRMNRPKGLTLTAILMALCNAMLWTINRYTEFPRPLRLFAFLTVVICIGYTFIWFYWKGKDWARIAVLIVSGLNIFNLRAWNTFSRIDGHHGFLAAPAHIMLVAKAVLSVALLYWLNTRPVVEFFKRDKIVVRPQF